MQGERGEAGAAEGGFGFRGSGLPLKILFTENTGALGQERAGGNLPELLTGP